LPSSRERRGGEGRTIAFVIGLLITAVIWAARVCPAVHPGTPAITSRIYCVRGAAEVELLDNTTLIEQAVCLVWRGQRIDHESGSHDDWINAVAGLVYAMRDQSEITTFVSPIVVSAPRTCFGDDPGINGGWSGGSAYAPHLDMYKTNWPVW
jgi:hypothetical protein